MRAIIALLLLIGFGFSATAQLGTNVSAQYKTRVVCKTGSSSTITINPSPASTSAGFESKDIGTSVGHEYQLIWKFMGRKNDKDVYHFTFARTTKAEGTSRIQATTSKNILFDGHSVTIFKDDNFTVTCDMPTEKKVETSK
jgi:hypothetical protein